MADGRIDVEAFVPKWREGGRCRVVCRPVRSHRRCFKASDVKRIIRYSIACGQSQEGICEAVGEVLPCVATCKDIREVAAAVDALKADVASDLVTLRAVLAAIEAIGSVVTLIPFFIRRFPLVRRLFIALEAIIAIADNVEGVIESLIAALDLVDKLVDELLRRVCNGEESQSTSDSAA